MKKLFFATLLFASLFIGCNDDKKDESTNTATSSDKANSTEDKEERNKKTALASIEGVNSHDANAVLKDAAPDAVDYGDGSMAPTKSLDSVRSGLTAWLKAFPDVKGENLKAVADGDWVVVWGDWSGTWKTDFMGQKATGKSYKLKDADIFKFNDDGKIAEHHTIQSNMAMAMQVGMK
jgi:predicted ester cyclase